MHKHRSKYKSKKRGVIFFNKIQIYYFLVLAMDKSIKVFSTIPVKGTNTKNQAKYSPVEICPISKNGLSGC